MIFPDVDIWFWATKYQIDIDKTQICSWGCNLPMTPRAAVTKESHGVKFECEQCDCWTYIGRPKDTEFWETIV